MARLVNQTFRFGRAPKLGEKLGFNKIKSDQSGFAKSHSVISLSIMLMLAQSSTSFADPLVKTIPAQSFNIPAGDLTKALTAYSANAGVLLSFDSELTHGKNTQGLKGNYSLGEGFANLLKGTGLEVVNNNKGELELRKAPVVKASESDNLPLNKELSAVEVRAKRFYEIGPMPGLGLTKEEIPGNVQSLTAKDIKDAHALSLADLMNSKLQSISVNDYQGNPFQMDVNYRGFTASPQLGTAQGISVFFDGIRVNEPFGDVVNWDMIPMNALKSIDIFPGSNPIFGLGTLGGAFAMRTKSGFDGESLDAEVLAGSYGRKQLQISAGDSNGVVAGFVSGNFFLEDGWRDNSPSKVNQVFGKAEWRNDRLQLGLSMLYAGNKLTGNGLLPEQMANQNRSQVYTSPDESKNDLLQFQLSGIWDVTDNFNVTGQVYKRNSKRKSKTTDINEDFDGFVSDRGVGKQVLRGRADVNNDGLPDYNDYALNIAAGPDGRALDLNGIAEGDAGFDITRLAKGTSAGSIIVAGQATVTASDGSGASVPSWTYDPRAVSNVSGAFEIFDFVTPSLVPDIFNNPLPDDYYQFALRNWNNKVVITNLATPPELVGYGPANPYTANAVSIPGNGQSNYFNSSMDSGGSNISGSYTDSGGFYHALTILETINNGLIDPNTAIIANGTFQKLVKLDSRGVPIPRDGAQPDPITGATGVGSGSADGTPNALITETEIDQVGTGGALQLNWNLEQHKMMVGASVDMADTKYASKEYLGLLGADRNGFAAPDLLGYEFFARDAARAQSQNDFKGDSITKSLYASETWTPIKTLNITAAARYNDTTVKNTLAVNNANGRRSLNQFLNLLDIFPLCPDSNGDGVVDPSTECPTGIDAAIKEYDGFLRDVAGNPFGQLSPPEKEKFRYRSLNPALGATWQAKENLNVYANWNRGARTPTVIELGCAYENELIPLEGTNPVIFQERSLAERRSCNLPSTMSGDPYLKQVRSKTFEVGARGLLTSNVEWNTSVYRTDLTDDIYFVSVSPSRSFFQNIGDTKRQGLEMGLKGKLGKASFGLNYSLTDATFQSAFRLDSPNNSSASADSTDFFDGIVDGKIVRTSNFGKIDVKKGNRMPGIPLHNLNANFSYELTDKWIVGLNAVMHSSALLRGNENNKHQAGLATPLRQECTIFDPLTNTTLDTVCNTPRADWGDGKTPGYTVFNFQTSYKLASEWTLGLQVNNLFDKKYASAGRLGLNAFSPSINGAIGASGFNYNSSEWQGSSFLGLGAPRSAYFTLTYQFLADKK